MTSVTDPTDPFVAAVQALLSEALTSDGPLATESAQRLVGVAPASELIERTLTGAALAWEDHVGPLDRRSGRRLLEGLQTVLPMLVESSQQARRDLVRQEEVVRQEFIDDLLRGDADVAGLVQRAEPFGLDLTLRHQIVMAQPTAPPGLHRWDESQLERAVVEQFGDREVLVTTKSSGLLALVPAAEDDHDDAARQVHQSLQRLDRRRSWRVASGRPYNGAYGIARSYEEAREALTLGERLQPELSVIRSRDLLMHRVLARDKVALADLVQTVLTPLTAARGGAEPLLETLTAYFSVGGVSAAAARQLHVSVRTVSYRLDRIRQLTGHDPADPAERFTLQTAVLGARLLGWPHGPRP